MPGYAPFTSFRVTLAAFRVTLVAALPIDAVSSDIPSNPATRPAARGR